MCVRAGLPASILPSNAANNSHSSQSFSLERKLLLSDQKLRIGTQLLLAIPRKDPSFPVPWPISDTRAGFEVEASRGLHSQQTRQIPDTQFLPFYREVVDLFIDRMADSLASTLAELNLNAQQLSGSAFDDRLAEENGTYENHRPRKRTRQTAGDLKASLEAEFLSPSSRFSTEWLNHLQRLVLSSVTYNPSEGWFCMER